MTERPPPLPDLDWSPERAAGFGRRAVELWEELLRRLPDLPVTRGRSASEVHDAVAIPVPDEPMSDDEVFAHLADLLFERSMYPGHPRFLAYVSGAGTVPGAPADLLAAAVNMNLGGWGLSPGGTEIELHLTRFFANRFGLPDTAGGLIVSGGAMANFVALKTARDRIAGWDVRTHGLQAGEPLTMYMSAETHVVTSRAADMLGLGIDAVRIVEVDGGFRVRIDRLREAIAADREAGFRPFAVVASAGTVATGAIDPLGDIADLCAAERLWFHVDGAYGGPAAFADDLRPAFAGIDRADSIAFDPHKWLYTPHSGGCVLVRDMQHLADSFAVHATYVRQDRERTGRGLDLSMFGPQFSRGFWALKIWVSILAHGWRAYRERISHDAALARYLGRIVEAHREFQLVCPVSLSICCFRFVPEDLADGPGREQYLDALNERLMTEAQQDGRVFFSNAVLDGRFALRVCIVNFRTEADDLDAVVEVTAELGHKLDAELRPADLVSPGVPS